ncbi:unnamed protein product [Plutella xylostella]|uniref:(diamondback moth) hypothetical protein n=1 Tax=Plutella xylostella TaxID=51655 RepID=A0A8S4FX33_PLUXY|nr:unnamed protein product [Plutella xylostella]
MARWENIESVQLFREYLRIESVHPNPDYEPCVAFFRRYAASLGLPMRVVEAVPGKPVVIITWQGLCPELPSIMLNSHMDVVPVYEEHWTHPPFSAHLTADGWVYARGSQDTKQLAIQHLEAVRRLMTAGVRLRRTVHVTVVPDEEIGGAEGMHAFTLTPEFRAMNVGLELDESMPPAHCGNDIVVFYGERTSIRALIKMSYKLLSNYASDLSRQHVIDTYRVERRDSILGRVLVQILVVRGRGYCLATLLSRCSHAI